MKHLPLILALTACGPDVAKEPAKPSEVMEGLRIMYGERLEAYGNLTSTRSGWPSVDDCDAALWAGLALYAGAEVDIYLAEYFPGEWHRRPATSCWTEDEGDVGSKSTISNDMLLGIMMGIWAKGDLYAAQRLAKFGEEHKWVMGKPFPEMASRVVLKPNQIGLLGKIIEKLSDGQDLRSYRKLPSAYFPVSDDYERHLQVIGILLHGELDSGRGLVDISQGRFERLSEYRETYPEDALFAAVWGLYSGDREAAARLLLDPGYQSPSYVRGAVAYHEVHWLLAAKVVLHD